MSSFDTRLRRRRLGVIHIVFFTVAASAPLTVLGGSVTTTFAVTGVTGVPLSFLLLAVALGLFAVGYAAMSRSVANAGAFYSYLAHGLGPTWAVAGAFTAILAYNAIQIGLYGLFGAALGDLVASASGVSLPWWAWGAAALIMVGVLGVRRVDLNANVLAVLLVLECIAVALFDIGAFAHPAEGQAVADALTPSSLFVPGVGAVFAFGVAAFVGFESGAIYSEECQNPRVTVARATFVAVGFTGLFYALSSWAMVVTVGSADLQKQTAEHGPGVVFASLAAHWGDGVATLANLLFLTSVFAALLSFHNGVARYLFALGRERVLPTALSRVGPRSGGPVAGSLAQTSLAAAVVALFALFGADPVLQLFTWLSGVAAVGVVLLMAGTSAAVVGFFRNRPAGGTLWQRAVAPTLATIALVALVALLIGNFDSLLGTDPTSPLRWILPALVLLAAGVGAICATQLKALRPDIYATIGTTGGVVDADDEGIVLDLPAVPRWDAQSPATGRGGQVSGVSRPRA
jgi:amino acid transporter